jgi:trimethylamine--corrinoid protein Co-methyltransferase
MRLTLEALTPAEIEKIHEATVELLGRVGLAFKSGPALELFRRRGFRTEGDRVFLEARQLEEALAAAPSEVVVAARDPQKTITIGPGRPPAVLGCSGVASVVDEAGRQRPAEFDDHKDMLRLSQTSPVLNMAASNSLYPTWPDPDQALLLQVYLALVMTDKPLVGQTEGAAVSEASIELARRAVGREDVPVLAGICNSLSPMAWDARMLEGVETYARLGQALNISCCSMCGATSPVHLLGAVLEANAEVLGGLVYAQLIAPGTPVIYGTTSSVMDMASMSLALGAPEYSLISVGCAQMAARYGLPFRGGGGLTDSRVLDAQAGVESAWNLLVTLNAGTSFMLQGLGVLESFMAASFDKWILDEEIVARLQRLARGFGEWPQDLIETVAEGTAAGGFLKLKSTLKNFRKEFYRPVLGDRRSFAAWREHDGDLSRQAWELVRKRLAAYERPQTLPEVLRDLADVFRRRTGSELPPIALEDLDRKS